MAWTDIPADLRDDRPETYTVYKYPDGSVRLVGYWRTGETPPDPEVRTNVLAQGLNEAAEVGNATAAAINAIVGGTASATVATSETATSATYADLTTTTDQVTVDIGSSGKAVVFLYTHAVPGASQAGYASFALSGANSQAATDALSLYAIVQGGAGNPTYSAVFVLTGLTAGSTTFKMKYRALTSGHSCAFSNRRIAVIPFP